MGRPKINPWENSLKNECLTKKLKNTSKIQNIAKLKLVI